MGQDWGLTHALPGGTISAPNCFPEKPMDEAIRKLKSTTFLGRRLTRRQIADVQRTARSFPGLSRNELAHTVCEHLNLHAPSGGNRVHTARRLLEQLEELGILVLPDKDESKRRGAQKAPAWTARSEPGAEIGGGLEGLEPLELRVVTEPHEVARWNELIDRHHYLGYPTGVRAIETGFPSGGEGRFRDQQEPPTQAPPRAAYGGQALDRENRRGRAETRRPARGSARSGALPHRGAGAASARPRPTRSVSPFGSLTATGAPTGVPGRAVFLHRARDHRVGEHRVPALIAGTAAGIDVALTWYSDHVPLSD